VCDVVKAEQEVSELSYTIDELNSRLEEADGLTGAQVCHRYTLLYSSSSPPPPPALL